jgi:hypothetical protein
LGEFFVGDDSWNKVNRAIRRMLLSISDGGILAWPIPGEVKQEADLKFSRAKGIFPPDS